jgi:AcrR family transcriptional regulator
MRSRGWAGTMPASDADAMTRILDAADEVVAERGSAMSIADVARRLGVTRQTVYRYFPGTDALLIASAMRSADGFIDRLAEHVGGQRDPVAAMVESAAFAVEHLAGDPQFENLLTQRRPDGVITSLTSDAALTFGRSIIRRFDVDWELHGFDDAALDELAELSLRTLHSILLDPGQPPRDGITLRRFIARWLGPAILYPRSTSLSDPTRQWTNAART